MPSGSGVALLGAAGLMLAGVPGIAGPAITVAVCGDPAHRVRIPMEGDDDRQRDCPKACHAACARRDAAEDEH